MLLLSFLCDIGVDEPFAGDINKCPQRTGNTSNVNAVENSNPKMMAARIMIVRRMAMT
jgi:hypothetical protein